MWWKWRDRETQQILPRIHCCQVCLLTKCFVKPGCEKLADEDEGTWWESRRAQNTANGDGVRREVVINVVEAVGGNA